MDFCKIPKDGKLYSIAGYTGIKIRYLKQNKFSKADWTYYIYYRIGGRNGKQVLQKVGTKSQGMTPKKAHKLRMQKMFAEEQTEMKKNAGPTILEIWQEYEKEKEQLSSFASIKNLFAYLEPFHNKSPQSLTTGEIKKFRQNLSLQKGKSGKMLSEQTKVHILKLLRTLLNYAAKNELCPKNEKLYIELPNINNTVQEFLTTKQLRLYIKEIKAEENLHIKAFLMTALFTGMRKNAILHLAWKDIDTKHNVIYLNFAHAKKKQSDYIPLPLPIKKILQQLPQKGQYIFLNEHNKARADYFQKAKEIKERIGLPKNFRPLYMLRHNYATLLASHGVDIYTIQKLLTHNSPAMTQRYAHLSSKRLKFGSKTVSKIIQKYFQD